MRYDLYGLQIYRPIEMAKQIMCLIVVLTMCTFDSGAQNAETIDPIDDGVIEEVVVAGVQACGMWPIEHRALIGCQYAELKSQDLKKVLELRPEFFETCLSCEGNQCYRNEWSRDEVNEELLCKRLFWTPRKVSRALFQDGLITPMMVSFSFKISTGGRVKDIEILSYRSVMSEVKVLHLLKDGAEKTRFEPLVIEDTEYEIIGLRSRFELDD